MPPIKTGLYLGGTEELEHLDPIDSGVDSGNDDNSDNCDSDDEEVVCSPPPNMHATALLWAPTYLSQQEKQPTKQAPRKVRFASPAVAIQGRRDHTVADARIMTLKQQDYNDVHVARQLAKEGFINYGEKTVAGRWRKIRGDIEKAEEEELDDNLSDWHLGEAKAFNNAEKRFRQEVIKLEQAKWKTISIGLNVSMNKKKYTAKACKERYEAMQNGTADVAFELDPDPVGRMNKRDERIAENKRRRAAAKQAIRDAEEDKKRKIAAAKERKLGIQLENVNWKQEKMAREREERRLREEKRLGKEAERKARKAGLQKLREEVEAKRRNKDAEAAVYRYYTGYNINRKHGNKQGGDPDSDEDERADYLADSDDSDASSDGDVPPPVLTQSERISNRRRSASRGRSVSVHPSQMVEVTKATLLNPRSIMTDSELADLLHERKLPRRGHDETHPEVIARLAADDDILDNDEVNDLLAKHFMTHKGSIAKRIQRLEEADAANSAAGKRGVKVTDPEFKEQYEGYKGEYASLLVDA
ncbi:uncharacterized protein LTR77_005672 [Saxophila tyrrhenica]|uniref:DUF7626 domain-containing protein n=1 Tax=Saxophila tyrrhenica TaxID=1690608 RepID=A0AAV9P954_9PEZI|nr:hypothetical protein LTR77_005672 [Saxophila tyrrhenica]